ncbi:MAG: hypothetical protein OXD43_06765 [Bacteroidetes bacterium]|nr:hypothetical protein [Bacteroidota bacterium]
MLVAALDAGQDQGILHHDHPTQCKMWCNGNDYGNYNNAADWQFIVDGIEYQASAHTLFSGAEIWIAVALNPNWKLQSNVSFGMRLPKPYVADAYAKGIVNRYEDGRVHLETGSIMGYYCKPELRTKMMDLPINIGENTDWLCPRDRIEDSRIAKKIAELNERKANKPAPMAKSKAMWARAELLLNNSDAFDEAYEEVLSLYPLLSDHGYKYRQGTNQRGTPFRTESKPDKECVRFAIDWLAKSRPSINTKKIASSYELKHQAEYSDGRGYITNGGFICAALMADIGMIGGKDRADEADLNFYINPVRKG